MTNTDDKIYISLGFIILLSIFILIVTYYYDKEKNTPQSMISIESTTKVDLEQYEPLIPSLFYINIDDIDDGLVGNIIARLAAKYKMRSHKPFYSRGLPLSLPREINQIFMHPSWMPWMPYSFGQYIAWTYCIVPNHLIIGTIRHPWIRYKKRLSITNKIEDIILGQNSLCREIGIHSLIGLRIFIREQKFLLNEWLTSDNKNTMRMTGLIFWINYDDLNRSLLVLKKLLGLNDYTDIYYKLKDYSQFNETITKNEEWIKNNFLDLELYQWSKELTDILVKEFYASSLEEEIKILKETLNSEFVDSNNIINMNNKEYKKFVLKI